MKKVFGVIASVLLGIALACSINPAVADITYAVATYLADTTYFRADTSTLTFPRVLAVKAQTADGSDNGNVTITGGGNTGSQGRGAYITINGNESGNGIISIVEGSNAGGVAITSGTTTTTGTFTSSKTTDLGWSIVDQTNNQACNTGCTSACVFGIDNETGSAVTTLVSCSATTADLCLCAGAS